jgi:hypothetical protein
VAAVEMRRAEAGSRLGVEDEVNLVLCLLVEAGVGCCISARVEQSKSKKQSWI